jgi:hypothetical protein
METSEIIQKLVKVARELREARDEVSSSVVQRSLDTALRIVAESLGLLEHGGHT